MAGGTPEHAALAAEVSGQLRDQLRTGPCRVFSFDLGVRVVESNLSTYPDVSVVCGFVERDPAKKTNILNPKVLVEVTSDSTEEYDRGQKLTHYQRIHSVESVVVISHREPRVEVHHRQGESWSKVTATGGTVAIECVACTLDVDRLYAVVRDLG